MKQSTETSSRIPMHTVLGVSLIACFIMFRYMMVSFDVYIMLGIVLILMMTRILRVSFDGSDSFWVLYVLIMFSFGLVRDDIGITTKRMIFLSALILLKILLQTDEKEWSNTFFNLLLVLGLIHTTSIIIEVINPSFIRMIRNLLNISEIEHRAAYLDGITTQPSIAGFNISIFACVCVIKFFKSEKTNQKMYLLFFLLGMSALLLTGKRTLFVGIVFCCFVVAYMYYAIIMRKGFRLFTFILIILIILPFIARLPIFSRNVDRLLYGDDAGRFLIWKVLIDNFRRSPLIGVGRDVYTSQMDIGAHDDYLRVLSENGLLGFTFFFLALMLPLVKTMKTFFRKRNVIKMMVFTKDKYIVSELLASIFWQILILLYALTGNPLNTIEQLCSYMAFTAMGLSAIKKLKPV